jgi:hypothetical protein
VGLAALDPPYGYVNRFCVRPDTYD